jgi:uncharacterized protein YkwD
LAIVLALLALAGCVSTVDPDAVTAATKSESVAVGPPVNTFRASEGRSALRRSAKADAAARAHARDMAENGFFAHRGSDGSSVGGRLKAAGCRFTGAAENIAKGQTSVEQVVADWITSPGHRTNLLGPYAQYGAARAGDVWVLVLASGC